MRRIQVIHWLVHFAVEENFDDVLVIGLLGDCAPTGGHVEQQVTRIAEDIRRNQLLAHVALDVDFIVHCYLPSLLAWSIG